MFLLSSTSNTIDLDLTTYHHRPTAVFTTYTEYKVCKQTLNTLAYDTYLCYDNVSLTFNYGLYSQPGACLTNTHMTAQNSMRSDENNKILKSSAIIKTRM